MIGRPWLRVIHGGLLAGRESQAKEPVILELAGGLVSLAKKNKESPPPTDPGSENM